MGWRNKHLSIFYVENASDNAPKSLGQPFVSCEFPGGFQLSALIDTGSIKFILSQEALRQMPASQPPSSPTKIKALSILVLRLVSAFVLMSFAGSNAVYDCDFFIRDNVVEPLQCISGWDFILANHLQLTISEASYFLVGPHSSTPLTPVSTHLGPCFQQVSTAPSRVSIADSFP